MASEDDALVAMYVERQVLDAAKKPVHLPTQCPRHDTCWRSEPPARVPPRGHKAAELSAPLIGPDFAKGRLVVILENLRDFGGWDLDGHEKGMRWLVGLARIDWTGKDGKGGRRRLFGNKETGQGGTDVWAQAVSYAATWLSAAGLLAKAWPGDVVPTKLLAETLDQIAMVQHVKCSPLGNRSRPSEEMWKACGRYVLRGELEILQPERLLVVGTEQNAEKMRTQILCGEPRGVDHRTVKLGSRKMTLCRQRRDLLECPVDMVVVPHAASPGGTARKLVAEFRDLVGTAP
jgi:hypothetical protein